MARFCGHCANALDADSTFCPGCGTPIVAIGAALAAELRAGIHSGVRSAFNSSSLTVPKTIWAGAIEIFWVLVTTMLTGLYLLGGVVAAAAAGLESFLTSVGPAHQAASFSIVGFLFCIVKLSLQVPIAYGLLTEKPWCCGLYLKTLIPLVLMTVIMGLGALTSSLSGGQVLGALVGLGLLVLQSVLVFQAKDELSL